jgi:predicted ATPase
MGQRMNDRLAKSVFHVEPTMLPLIIFHMVTTSLKHGLDPSSPGAFAGLGLLLCGPLGKPQKGREMAKAAELILAKPGMRSSTSLTISVTQSFCYHWTVPVQDTIAQLLKGFQVGLEIGDTECACSCLVFRSYHLHIIGRSLDSIQHELEATIEVVTQLK